MMAQTSIDGVEQGPSDTHDGQTLKFAEGSRASAA